LKYQFSILIGNWHFDIKIIMSYSNFYARFYNFRQRVGSAIGAIWRFLPNRWYLLFFISLQLIAWLQTMFIYRNLTGNFLVLHYNISFGINLVGEPQRIFIYPIFGLAIMLVNVLILASLHRLKDFKTFAHLLLGTAVLFGFLLSLALFAIYLINFR